MRFDQFRYLWPPRPETAVPPDMLHHYEEMGWWAQAKLNGTNTSLYVSPHRETVARGRHGPDHELANWQPGERWTAFANALPKGGWYVFSAELMHSKVKGGPRDTLYLHDILVADGEYLVGRSYRERHRGLDRLCARFSGNDGLGIEVTHRVVSDGIWLALNRRHSFREWFDAPAPTVVEGLVVKNPAAPLALCSKATANGAWQVKARRSTDHLSF